MRVGKEWTGIFKALPTAKDYAMQGATNHFERYSMNEKIVVYSQPG